MDCVVERCSNTVLMERTENAQSQGPEFLVRGGRENKGTTISQKCEGSNAERTVIAPRLNVSHGQLLSREVSTSLLFWLKWTRFTVCLDFCRGFLGVSYHPVEPQVDSLLGSLLHSGFLTPFSWISPKLIRTDCVPNYNIVTALGLTYGRLMLVHSQPETAY
jgi:hypothetical protein